jgi:PKD repeat protein
MMLRRLTASLIATLAIAAAFASAAAGMVAHSGGRAFGGFASPASTPTHARPAPASGPVTGSPPLLYRGGPVDHALTARVIYWSGSAPTHPIPAAFSSGLDAFVRDFAASASLSGNLATVARQYVDPGGAALTSLSAEPSISDSDAYPASGGCATSTTYPVCLTDAQLVAELGKVISSNNAATGLSTAYMIVVPPDVQVCLSSAAPPSGTCLANAPWCAYHSHAAEGGVDTAYTVLAVPSNAPCESPNGPHGNPALDGAITLEAHELLEVATDPNVGTGYVDSAGEENGDDCAWLFGTTSPAASGGQYNQTLGGNQYLIQQTWSNQGATCASSLSSPPVSVAVSGTSTVPLGSSTTFTAGLQGEGASGATYQWHYLPPGAGTAQTQTLGAGPSTTFTPTQGTGVVWATATDASGSTIVGAAQATALPAATAQFQSPAGGATMGQPVSFDGSGSSSPNGPIAQWSWDFGDGTTAQGATVSHAFAAAGSFTVTLTITDSKGLQASVQHAVTIAPAAGSSGPGAGSGVAGNSAAGVGGSAIGVAGAATSGVRAPSPAQLRALLSSILAPHGKTAKIAGLLAHGYSFTWHAPSAGRLTLSWYQPATHHRARVLVATVTRTFNGPGTTTIKVTLTPAGRRLLGSARHLSLSASGSFAPTGTSATSALTAFTLTR